MPFRPTRRAVLTGAASLPAALAGPGPLRAAAAAIVPGLVYAVGQKFDKSFNEGAYTGAQRFRAATGIAVLEYEPQSLAQFDQGVAALVRRSATDIAAVGFYYATPLAALAPQHPDTRFTIVDSVVDRPNVRSVTFKEQEGSFLAGVMAALASRTGTIGFIGAMDIPLIRRFITGYEQGARHARPGARVLVNFVGTTPAAFNDPTTGAEIATDQFQRDADVVFAGAGTSNFGIFTAARDRGRLAIGVDSNQNGLYPGTILTSMLKHTDRAVEGSFRAALDGAWTPGEQALGLAEGGVDVAIDDNNRPLLTPAMLDAVETARAAIVAGRITVTTG